MKEIEVQYDKMASIESAIQLLKDTLESMEESDVMILFYFSSQSELNFNQVEIPAKNSYNVPFFGEQIEKKFSVYPPTSIEVIGSYALQTVARPYENVDVAITVIRFQLNLRVSNC